MQLRQSPPTRSLKNEEETQKPNKTRTRHMRPIDANANHFVLMSVMALNVAKFVFLSVLMWHKCLDGSQLPTATITLCKSIHAFCIWNANSLRHKFHPEIAQHLAGWHNVWVRFRQTITLALAHRMNQIIIMEILRKAARRTMKFAVCVVRDGRTKWSLNWRIRHASGAYELHIFPLSLLPK